ncbi:MAG TPA: hypothetical protein O0X48_01670 [Methanocorpusculum sp.]|nr:hypothetical protein [Methanocorpusculum sp.]
MTPQERNTKIILIILITAGVLLVLSGPLLFLLNAGLYEEFNFRVPTEPIPENAVIIELTEEDYEKYPILRNIPESFHIDQGILSDYYIRPGCVDKETGYAIREAYGYYTGGQNRYIEHNGVIYEVYLYVS